MTSTGVTKDRSTLLMGTISLDRYLASGEVLPGGGVLNMAWHWRQLGRDFWLLTRVGAEDGEPTERFLDGHDIDTVSRSELATPGRSSTIDIEILPDRQPWMDHFTGGVWDDYRLTPSERADLASAERLHVVLVEGAIAELERLAADGALEGIAVSADFLGFRHYTIDRLAATMRHVDLGLIGWPGAEDAPEVAGMRQVAFELGRVLVVTMGSRSVHVFDGRAPLNGGPQEPTERRFAVTPVDVVGTTLGCGDAFMAWFLDELWRSGDHAAAVARGMMGGALATEWQRPLPDSAYDLLRAPLHRAD
ncbi:MAG TPA: carbohydrate kinase family protein [Candidatus Limnocylindria bacterium]|nr:carbohydrate kinase family protein [Candidatus Limnocylindria bacterium]